ncbi:cyclin-like protein [Collybia nuda]|uniref:Cyclin-like protein n=1 Tax=Collybia nuda TaxID=64659 RepID=A0A9P5XWQ5_9AGAR|nr:cyclin-like protein [Collybia nuda]
MEETTLSIKRPLYEASTQFRNWRYSPEQLSEIRTSLNNAAVGVIRTTFEAQELGSSTIVSFLTPDEERLLVKLYVTKITQLCGLFRFPEEVEATAASYLKRFYLKNTVMDWHPKNVMYVTRHRNISTNPWSRRLTALFLATKTTNNPISLEAYTTHIPKTAPSDVLDLEFLVAQSLGFEFSVWHPHRALWGMWLDLQSLPDCPVDLRHVYDIALNYIRASRLTDAELIYTPSQIALAALSLAAPELATTWSRHKMQGEGAPLLLSNDAISVIVEGVKNLIITTGVIPDVESVREVDKRLRLCKNPEKVVGSAAYIAKKAENERIAEEKRNKKAEDIRRAVADSDPFGDELTGQSAGLVDYDDDDDDD